MVARLELFDLINKDSLLLPNNRNPEIWEKHGRWFVRIADDERLELEDTQGRKTRIKDQKENKLVTALLPGLGRVSVRKSTTDATFGGDGRVLMTPEGGQLGRLIYLGSEEEFQKNRTKRNIASRSRRRNRRRG